MFPEMGLCWCHTRSKTWLNFMVYESAKFVWRAFSLQAWIQSAQLTHHDIQLWRGAIDRTATDPTWHHLPNKTFSITDWEVKLLLDNWKPHICCDKKCKLNDTKPLRSIESSHGQRVEVYQWHRRHAALHSRRSVMTKLFWITQGTRCITKQCGLGGGMGGGPVMT